MKSDRYFPYDIFEDDEACSNARAGEIAICIDCRELEEANKKAMEISNASR